MSTQHQARGLVSSLVSTGGTWPFPRVTKWPRLVPTAPPSRRSRQKAYTALHTAASQLQPSPKTAAAMS